VDHNGDLLIYERAAVRRLATDGSAANRGGAVEQPHQPEQLPTGRQVPVIGAVSGVRQSSVVESGDGTSTS
jgi:hypothetical protein